MKRATEKRTSPFRLAVLGLAMAALAGCGEGTGSPFSKTDAQDTTETPKTGGKKTERDVEAPEVFEVTEAGLWDGRPSLGGIWVAHPDVTQPARVMIRNTSNDKSTVGALFRRERAIPGPIVQVSSDAAAALGMLAGAPVKVHVVALKRETVEPEPKPEAAAPPKTEEPAKKPEATVQEPVKTAEPDAKTEALTIAAADQAPQDAEAADAEEAPAKRKWFWQKRPKAGEITESTLAPVAVAGATAVAAATAAGSNADAAPAETPAQPSGTSSLTKPYVQIGTYTVEENAKTAAKTVSKTGLNAEVRTVSNNDKTIWRVVVGPAANRSERKDIMAKVEGLGFADAYIVKN
ncbi:SPOR domain-containing protein [Ruegeria sediminis]|uniref:SPOR domain-containing protein n=1 Tax=Ruegeria sediminis TaxID=2583820 RepID=A0ABY2WZK1_9RHOB|nr:SPOR domain-containing protein [Ruegeria sediminis]TMV08026.1 SPOR domain-containing protein [Ruegeria sediminis]